MRLTPARSLVLAALLALLIGAGVGAGVGSVVGGVVRGRGRSVLVFAPNRSLLPRLHGVPAILARALPAVVSIHVRGACGDPGDSTEASGMVLTATGEILTNAHVVAGGGAISVTWSNGTPRRATVVGIDSPDDVALLRVAGVSGLRTVAFASAAPPPIGEGVLAVGDALALSSARPSASEGIVSALGRSLTVRGVCGTGETLTDLLQTQAAINAGNSGGPLIDASGRVVGMNTATAGSSLGNAPTEDIGFAIPVGDIEALLPGLRRGGLAVTTRSYLGVDVVSLTPALRLASRASARLGAYVETVEPGSPAARSGLRSGDVIVAFAGAPIASAGALSLAVRGEAPGRTVVVVLDRMGRRVTLRIRLAPRPPAR